MLKPRFYQCQNRGLISVKTAVLSMSKPRFCQCQNRGFVSAKTAVLSVPDPCQTREKTRARPVKRPVKRPASKPEILMFFVQHERHAEMGPKRRAQRPQRGRRLVAAGPDPLVATCLHEKHSKSKDRELWRAYRRRAERPSGGARARICNSTTFDHFCHIQGVFSKFR